MPEYIFLRSLDDSTAICELKLYNSGQVEKVNYENAKDYIEPE